MMYEHPYPWSKPDAQWVMSWRVEPPLATTLMGQTGGTMFFCSYARFSKKWELLANGKAEEINPPEFIWLSEQWAKEHPNPDAFPPVEKPTIRKSKKPQQMQLL